MDTEKLVRKTLRMKLLAGGKPGEYVLNVSPAGVKVAHAPEYHLAILAGMEDFWQLVPVFDGACDLLSALERNADGGDGECRVSCIFDGHSKTFTTNAVCVVPEGYVCSMASAEEVRNAVRKAKEQSSRRNGKGNHVEGRFAHAEHYTISKDDADELKAELLSQIHSPSFTMTLLKLIDNATVKDA